MQVCATDRLQLRHFNVQDAPFIVALLDDPGFIRYIADKQVRTEADAIGYLVEGPLASYRRNGFGLNAVVHSASNTLIGMCGVILRDGLPNPDLGYAFLSEHCNQGFATEACIATVSLAQAQWKIPTLLAITLPENTGSARVLQKLGFSPAGSITLNKQTNNLFELTAS